MGLIVSAMVVAGTRIIYSKGGNMAKVGKMVRSDWAIGAHTVNSYKARVSDPAVKRKRRSSKEICDSL